VREGCLSETSLSPLEHDFFLRVVELSSTEAGFLTRMNSP
jgi:hypothetical protein